MRIPSLNSVVKFVTFESPTIYEDILARFMQVHQKQTEAFPKWSLLATKQLLISDYWYQVLTHYSALSLGCILGITILSGLDNITGAAMLIAISFCLYLPIYSLLYRPTYSNEFIPKLETVIAEFEGNQRIWVEKCKQEQLSTRGLVLLYYILDKCAEINYLTPSDKSASLLLKIFGVSQKGLKNELDLLFKKEKRAKIEQRKQTEITKSFEEVYAILEEMQFPKGVQMLKELEIRFNRPE